MSIDITQNHSIQLAGASALAFCVGALASYFVTRKYLAEKFEAQAQEDIQDVKRHYNVPTKPETPEAALEQFVPQDDISSKAKDVVEKILEDNSYALVVDNVEDTTWDYKTEIANRDADIPYVIHYDEFMENEHQHEQVTLTYYETNQVLVDDKDEPLNDMDIVGVENLTRFGYGSNDENVVYIRNETIGIDIELVYSGLDFARDILGLN